MAVAVRLSKLDSSNNVIGNIDFERKEIMHTDVRPLIESVVQRSQTGAPTMFINSNEYHEVEVTVRIFGTATESKLTELRNFIMAGGIVRVYPKWYQDQTVYYDCFIEPNQLAVLSAFSGQSRAGQKLKLIFLETDEASQYVVSSEIVIE